MSWVGDFGGDVTTRRREFLLRAALMSGVHFGWGGWTFRPPVRRPKRGFAALHDEDIGLRRVVFSIAPAFAVRRMKL